VNANQLVDRILTDTENSVYQLYEQVSRGSIFSTEDVIFFIFEMKSKLLANIHRLIHKCVFEEEKEEIRQILERFDKLNGEYRQVVILNQMKALLNNKIRR
jgi:hypothetical protein